MSKFREARLQQSLKKSARKAVRASKSFVGTWTSKVSFVRRKALHKAPQESIQPPPLDSFIFCATSSPATSTAPSLPVPDCGAHFGLPGFETVKDTVTQDSHATEVRVVEPISGRGEYKGSSFDDTAVPEDLTIHPYHTQGDQSTVRADSALDLRSKLGPESASSKDSTPVKASKMKKVHQWVKRIKARLSKLSRNKPPMEVSPKDAAKETNEGKDEADNDDEDEDEDEDECDQYPRCEFDVIESIRDISFQTLVRSQCKFILPTDSVVIVHRTRGSWNFAAMVDIVRDGVTIQECVVRVPGHGTPFHWTQEDAYMMDREVQLIKHIRKNTSAPVPEIISFDSTHNSILCFPYILMIKLPGDHAGHIWFDQPHRPNGANYAYRTADVPAASTEKKRLNFLRSLAHHMTAIQALSFDKIGMVEVLDEDRQPIIGPHYHWKNDGSDEAVERAAADSTQSYALEAMSKKFRQPEDPEKDGDYYKARGNQVFFDIILSQAVFRPSEPETFTIHHNDLDFQNILVDEDGNVTGIIDWDASYTAPRCIGAAAVPIFLRNDWFPRYVHDIRLTPHMGWNYQHYREVYAAAMLEAGNPDAHFTLNSALYQSVFAAVTEFGNRYSLVEKLLPELPDCRVDARDFQIGLGLGWTAAEEMLREQLPKIFEPKLPRPGLLAQLEAELVPKLEVEKVLNEWWLTFDTYLAEDKNDSEDGDPEASSVGDGKSKPTSTDNLD